MKTSWTGRAVAAALALALTTGTAHAKGSDMSPQDVAAMKGYVLSVDKFNKWASATAAIKRDTAKNPALKAADKDETPTPTIAATLAKLKRHPEMAAYYRRAGLSDTDTVMIPMVAISASMATMVPEAKWGQLPVSRDQILFMKAHQKEMSALSKGSDNDD